MKKLLLIGFILLFAKCDTAQTNESIFTKDFMNGYAWKEFTADGMKSVYLRGHIEGLKNYRSTLKMELESFTRVFDRIYDISIPAGDLNSVIEKIDQFYEDKRNLKIPIVNTLMYFAIQKPEYSEGADFNSFLEQMRVIFGAEK
ncbi:MAG: hypothetical protein K9J12_03220 [Melioribacteraceae bacterium]|nr:hypothetical protein [Melioribacteraceae bacterium]MCF8266299.1 hypothetical protein [Melioribacteraceae bacterium]MCF8413018.1 hypothetical protein [Melioribacteraceae bacterium]